MLISNIIFIIFVVELAIGLDFVKNIDKNWKKHIQSLDRNITDEESTEIFDYSKKNQYNKTKIQKEDNDPYWDYWKKRYWLLK